MKRHHTNKPPPKMPQSLRRLLSINVLTGSLLGAAAFYFWRLSPAGASHILAFVFFWPILPLLLVAGEMRRFPMLRPTPRLGLACTIGQYLCLTVLWVACGGWLHGNDVFLLLLLAAAGAFFAPLGLLLRGRKRLRLELDEPHCRNCHYSLRGLPADRYRCPECGAVF